MIAPQNHTRRMAYALGECAGQFIFSVKRGHGAMRRCSMLANLPRPIKWGLLITLLIAFGSFVGMAFLVISMAHFMRCVSGERRIRDFRRYQAYGDPYGEYELGRKPGQPDLD